MYLYIFTYIHTKEYILYIYIHKRVYIYIHIYIHIYIEIHTYIHTYIHTQEYIYIYAHMSACMFARIECICSIYTQQYTTMSCCFADRFGDPFEILVDGPGSGWHRWNHCCTDSASFLCSQKRHDDWPITNGEVTDLTNKNSSTMIWEWLRMGYPKCIYNIRNNQAKV